MPVRFLKLLVTSLVFAFCSVCAQATENSSDELHKDLLTHNFYRGATMYLNENHGLSLRELRLRREGDLLTFTLADRTENKTLTLKISEAQRTLQPYPFGLPQGEEARDQLQQLQWKHVAFTWDNGEVEIDTVHLFFKSDELLNEEKSYGMSFMPPLHRVLLRFDSNNYEGFLDGGLYSEAEVEKGDWDKALSVLTKNYEILVFNEFGGCEQALTHDEH